MSERAEETYIQGDRDEEIQREEENDGYERTTMMPDEAYLLELNLVMIIASLTLSNQEISEFEEDVEKLNVKEQQDFKTIVSKLHARKRVFDELKIPGRRGTRSQQKILDSRHGRKM